MVFTYGVCVCECGLIAAEAAILWPCRDADTICAVEFACCYIPMLWSGAWGCVVHAAQSQNTTRIVFSTSYVQ
jgi:hypothetical protein